MKKLLLSLTVFAAAFAANAQMDTLSAHCNSTTLYNGLIDQVAPIDTGFYTGTNGWGDLAKMQLFDGTHGVTNSGTIKGVAFLTSFKADGGGNIQVSVRPDNAGTPDYANPIATTTVQLSAIDTSMANTSLLADGNFFNHVAMFSAPVNIPAGNKFWAGVVLPTGVSDAFALAMSYPFTDAATNTGEIQSNDPFYSFNDGTSSSWGLNAALTVFPIVDFTLGLNESEIATSVFPNPTNSELNIKTTEEVASVVITAADGKVVATSNTTNVNVASLNAGMYIYQVTTASGKVGTGNFIKN